MSKFSPLDLAGGEDVWDSSLPEELPDFVLRYGIYRQIWSPRRRNNKGELIVDSAHNAGNDAVAELKVASCIVLDSIWGTDSYESDDDDPHGYMADVLSADAQAVLIDR